METYELAFTVDDPPVRLAVPEGDARRAEFDDLLRRIEADRDLTGGAAALLALSGRIASSEGSTEITEASTPDSLAVLLSRCALTQLAARLLRSTDERERGRDLLRTVVAELADAVDAGGGSDALALWLSARSDLYWAELQSLPAGVTTFGDLGRALQTAVDAIRDGRLDERTGFGLLRLWIEEFDRPGLKDAATFLRAQLVELATERHGPLALVTLELRHLEADLLETHGQLEKAWKLFERLVRDIDRAGENGGMLAVQVRSGHAFLAGRRGSPRRAVRLYRELLADIVAGRLAGDSSGPYDAHAPAPGTAYQSAASLVRMNLATWLIEQGELAEAAEVLDAVVEDATATVMAPGEPFEVAAEALQQAQRRLGTALRDLGRHEESVDVLRALLAGRLAAATPDEAAVDDARALLMAALLRTGDHTGARPLGESLLGSRAERLGMREPSTVLAAVQLGVAEHALGDPAAREAVERFTEELRGLLGDGDERTLTARVLVQSVRARDGDATAAALADEVLRDCLQHLGSRHHLTRDARRAAGG